eukprot:scaffold35192_cov64-Phaeocystis_antarctica.AAC.9
MFSRLCEAISDERLPKVHTVHSSSVSPASREKTDGSIPVESCKTAALFCSSQRPSVGPLRKRVAKPSAALMMDTYCCPSNRSSDALLEIQPVT